MRDALRGQVVAIERGPSGALLTATGVQIPGVLDDLYAGAAKVPLGPTGRGGLAVWAPTARKVELALYDGPEGGRRTVHGMRRDDATGVWSIDGPASWKGRYYTYLVTVYAPAAGKIVTNEVTDPYSLSVSAGSGRSQIVDLDDRSLRPDGWTSLKKPPAVRQDRASIYELHVRDFSASDTTVPEAERGTYKAFTETGSAGMTELRSLAKDGLTHVHLLPAFDFATVPDRKADRTEPACDLAALPPDSDRQQACVAETAANDSFNWGYDPLHYTVPEGSYATGPDKRIKEFREMVAGLNGAGLRVVMDVVYNHTHAAGQDPGSVLDRVVPGYYHRLMDDGTVAASTCCANTAPEHAMMGRLRRRLDRHLGEAVQGGRLPVRPDGPPPEGEHPGRAQGPRRAHARQGRRGRQVDHPVRRGLELRRGGRRRQVRAGHPGQHGGHRDRHVQRPAARRGARRLAVRRRPRRPGFRLGPGRLGAGRPASRTPKTW